MFFQSVSPQSSIHSNVIAISHDSTIFLIYFTFYYIYLSICEEGCMCCMDLTIYHIWIPEIKLIRTGSKFLYSRSLLNDLFFFYQNLYAVINNACINLHYHQQCTRVAYSHILVIAQYLCFHASHLSRCAGLFHVTLIQARVTGEEGASFEKMP